MAANTHDNANKDRAVDKLPWNQVHFIGVGGVGMSGIATILLERGVSVFGSDELLSPAVERLRAGGARISVGPHCRDNLPPDTDMVVFSSAVSPENPEMAAAESRGLPSCRRGEFLARLAEFFEVVVAVAGSHGKTTTTALLTHILRECGLKPGYLIGGEVPAWSAPASAGNGRILVTEVDESDGTQAYMRSTHAIVLNVEDDHCWSVGGVEALERCFHTFAHQAGKLFAWESHKTRELFGNHAQARFCSEADVPPRLSLPVGGKHNRLNATLALAVAADLGIPQAEALTALTSFPGVSRRLTCHYTSPDGNHLVIEDYAHHPTELAAALQALRESWPEHRLTVVFQPHRFERVKRYGQQFAELLDTVDRVIVTAPFAAWKQDADLADPRQIVDGIRSTPAIYWQGPLEALAGEVTESMHDDRPEVVVVVGAGDIGKLPPMLTQQLTSRYLDRTAEQLRARVPGLDVARELSWGQLTSLGIGKARPLLVRPRTVEELKTVLGIASERGLPIFRLGAGSNLLGSDADILQLVVQLSGGEFAETSREGAGTLSAGTGTMLPKLWRALAETGVLPAAVAPLVWIPGTLGGAVCMNASAHGASIRDVVDRLDGVTFDGQDWSRSAQEIAWNYRAADIPDDVMICRVTLKLGENTREAALQAMATSGDLRRASQPGGRTTGCAFRNAGTTPAGKLLDQCGCKQMTRGGCRISDLHANFIVAQAGATEADFRELLLQARRRVFDATGVLLHPEVRPVNPKTAQRITQSIAPWAVAVLMGGPSSEREISLKSGAAVARALREAGHTVHEIDVTGRMLPDLPLGTDAVFPALHGEFGEDGGIQALLEANRIPYVGSGPRASRLMMDKAAAKDLVAQHGIPTPKYHLLTERDMPLPADLTLPLIVKPSRQGSSVGLSRLDTADPEPWQQALKAAFAVDREVLAEEFVEGPEITVGVLHGQALPVVEIVPPEGCLFDFDAKYTYARGQTHYLCPPETIGEQTQLQAQTLASKAAELLGARHLVRVDFLVDRDGQPVFLEANSLPGFTATSLLPKAAAAVGISFPELCAGLVQAALGEA